MTAASNPAVAYNRDIDALADYRRAKLEAIRRLAVDRSAAPSVEFDIRQLFAAVS